LLVGLFLPEYLTCLLLFQYSTRKKTSDCSDFGLKVEVYALAEDSIIALLVYYCNIFLHLLGSLALFYYRSI